MISPKNKTYRIEDYIEADRLEYFIVFWKDTQDKAFILVDQLRQIGYSALMSTRYKGISKQLDEARRLNTKKTIFLGPEELIQNKIRIKNMDTGEEVLLVFLIQ